MDKSIKKLNVSVRLWLVVVPRSSSEQVLGVCSCRIYRQTLSSQQQLARSHGDVLQVPDHLHLVVLFLKMTHHNIKHTLP